MILEPWVWLALVMGVPTEPPGVRAPGEAAVKPGPVTDSVWRAGGRALTGIDTNVLQDSPASTTSPVLRLEGRVALEYRENLLASLEGEYQQHIVNSDVSELRADLRVAYRASLTDRLSLRAGGRGTARRELTIFSEGTLSRDAHLRLEGGGQINITPLFALAPAQMGISATLEGKGVDGGETYGFVGGAWGPTIAVAPNQFVAARAAYDYALRSFSGLAARDQSGQVVPDGPEMFLGLHRLRLALYVRPNRILAWRLGYRFEYFKDNFLNYLTGPRHRTQVGCEIRAASTLEMFLGGAMAWRGYPERVASATNNVDELYIEGYMDVRFWLMRNVGVSLRYEVDRVSAAPLGSLYLRHMVFVGPAASTRDMEW